MVHSYMPNCTAFTNFTIQKCDLQKNNFSTTRRRAKSQLRHTCYGDKRRPIPFLHLHNFCCKGALKIWGIAYLRLNLYNFGIHRANPAKVKNKSATKLHTVPENFQKKACRMCPYRVFLFPNLVKFKFGVPYPTAGPMGMKFHVELSADMPNCTPSVQDVASWAKKTSIDFSVV